MPPTDTTSKPYSSRLRRYQWVLGDCEEALRRAAVAEVLTDAPLKEVAASLGISPQRLTEIVVAKTGMTPTQYRDHKGWTAARLQARADEKQRAGIEMALMFVDGASAVEIGERYGVSNSRVTQLVTAATGKTPRQLRAQCGWVHGIPPHVKEAVLEAYRANPQATLGALAEQAGTTRHSAKAVLAAQVPPLVLARVRSGSAAVASRLPTTDELVRLYVEERLSTVDLGARFGVDPSTVGKRLKDAGIRLKRR